MCIIYRNMKFYLISMIVLRQLNICIPKKFVSMTTNIAAKAWNLIDKIEDIGAYM